MDNGYARFFQRNPMTEDESRKLFEYMQFSKFSRGEVIVESGGFNSNFYVIDRGIWSGGQFNKDNVNITLWFAFSGECVFNVWNFVMGLKSPISIISETDSTAYYIEKEQLEKLISDNKSIEICFRKIILGHLAWYENRLLEMSEPENAGERYLWISKWHPELLQEVSMTRIASFLGITIQSLSRIRREIYKNSRI